MIQLMGGRFEIEDADRGRDRNTARLTLDVGLAVSAFPPLVYKLTRKVGSTFDPY